MPTTIPEKLTRAPGEPLLTRGLAENKTWPTDPLGKIARTEAPLMDAQDRLVGVEKTTAKYKGETERSRVVETYKKTADNKDELVRTKQFDFDPETGNFRQLVIEDAEGNTVRVVRATSYDGEVKYGVQEDFFEGDKDYPQSSKTLDSTGTRTLDEHTRTFDRFGKKILMKSSEFKVHDGTSLVTSLTETNIFDDQGRIIEHREQRGEDQIDSRVETYKAEFKGKNETRKYRVEVKRIPADTTPVEAYRENAEGTIIYENGLLRLDSYEITRIRGNNASDKFRGEIQYQYDSLRRHTQERTIVNDELTLETNYSYFGLSTEANRKEEVDHGRGEIRPYRRVKREWVAEPIRALNPSV